MFVNAAHGQQRRTPLHFAAKHGHVDTVRRLLASAPIIAKNGADRDEKTPLAPAKDDLRTSEIAINNEPQHNMTTLAPTACVNTTDTHGMNALHLAAQSGHFQVVELLLSYPDICLREADTCGADLNEVKLLAPAKTQDRRTRECVKTLPSHDNGSLADAYGVSALRDDCGAAELLLVRSDINMSGMGICASAPFHRGAKSHGCVILGKLAKVRHTYEKVRDSPPAREVNSDDDQKILGFAGTRGEL